MCPVELRQGGLCLAGTGLWLDARRRTELSFVSHAHRDHIARHHKVIATSATLRLMQHRLGEISSAYATQYNCPFSLGAHQVELLPAGHVLGSAQIRITRADGRRVVYTGDINLAPSLTAEPAQIASCDTLVIESTFGHPRYLFPPKELVLSQLEAWVRGKLQAGVTPVLFAYSLGKAQEVIRFLSAQGFSSCAHGSIYEIGQLYSELGVPWERVRRFDGPVREAEVVVFPPQLSHSPVLSALRPRATAVLSGWALDGRGRRCRSADAAFPLSDHADFAGLVSYAKATGAREVLTHSGFAKELAQALRSEGIEARALGEPLQLRLL
jgi:putative mRNA 3-end processing factor